MQQQHELSVRGWRMSHDCTLWQLLIFRDVQNEPDNLYVAPRTQQHGHKQQVQAGTQKSVKQVPT